MKIEPFDIVDRLVRAKPFWFNGNPIIKLIGTSGTFGRLLFDFGDEIIHYNIRIKDRKHILDVANDAVKNFNRYVKSFYE